MQRKTRKYGYINLFFYLCKTMEEKDYKTRPKTLFSKYMNKYTIIILISGIWLAFLDNNSLIERVQLWSKIKTLKKEKTYYQKKLEEDTRKTQELLSDKKNLEKFAREEYLMKRPNEEIFVIVNE